MTDLELRSIQSLKVYTDVCTHSGVTLSVQELLVYPFPRLLQAWALPQSGTQSGQHPQWELFEAMAPDEI